MTPSGPPEPADAGSAGPTSPELNLDIVDAPHPRVFFFRSPENIQNWPNYARWQAAYRGKLGIFGKLLNEEYNPQRTNPGDGRAGYEFFQQFKREHPRQMVLLHFNGRGRDPADQFWRTSKYFAGHWLYHVGTRTTRPVPIAASGEVTEVHVQDASVFALGIGNNNDRNDDIVMVPLDSAGRPRWLEAEQVRLASKVDATRIRVVRGQYGTPPRDFSAEPVMYLAPHVTEGPWGGTDPHLLWFYNCSTVCPPDPNGRRAADVLLDEIVSGFGPGGMLEGLDGVTFDVMYSEVWRATDLARGIDSDGDTKDDRALVGGVNAYGVGQRGFQERLRARLGPTKLLMGDSYATPGQRGFGVFNGMEIEDFYQKYGVEWSGNLNRNLYWRANVHPPALNYLKISREDGFQRVRFALANALMADFAVTSFDASRPSPDFDELIAGREARHGWLGAARGPPVRLAKRTADLFRGAGAALASDFQAALEGPELRSELDGAELRLWRSSSADLSITLPAFPTGASDDVTIFVTMRAKPRPVYGANYARVVRASARDPAGRVVQLNLKPDNVGAPFVMSANDLFGIVGTRPIELGFHFHAVPADIGQLRVRLEVEGPEELWISSVTAHAAPDAVMREWEGGVALANPDRDEPFDFNLAELLPGRSLRRIDGHDDQDPMVNDGARVGASVRVPPADALFLVN